MTLVALVCAVVGIVVAVAIYNPAIPRANLALTIDLTGGYYAADGSFEANFSVVNGGTSTASLAPAALGTTVLPAMLRISSNPLAPGSTATGTESFLPVAGFDGNASVVVANSTGLNSPEFTVEVAFEYANETSPAAQVLLGKGSGASSNSFFFTNYPAAGSPQSFVLISQGNRMQYVLGSLQSGTWYDAAFDVGNTSVDVYLNGALAVTGPLPKGMYSGNENRFVVGACGCGGYDFNGSVAFVRYYAGSLSSSEIAYNFFHPATPVNDGLDLWLNFANVTGSHVPNLVNSSQSGQILGRLDQSQPIPPGSSVGIGFVVVVMGGTEVGIILSGMRTPSIP